MSKTHLYFKTSAKRKLSWKFWNEPPFSAFTSVISAKPDPVLQVALIALKPFQEY